MIKFKLGFLILFSFALFQCGEDDPKITLDSTPIKNFTIDGINGEIDHSSKTILVNVPLDSDLEKLTPIITVSSSVSISPESGVVQNFSNPVDYTVTHPDESQVVYSVTVTLVKCAEDANVIEFEVDGKKYEIIKEAKTWENAVKCAKERGGYLAEIDSETEQNSIFANLRQASINNASTIAPDGGNASYVWLGGNDLEEEGTWVWDGDNSGTKTSFWIGTASGMPVEGRYSNWGNEPDDFDGQDALGLALTDWPLGVAGQWNDVDHNNQLYYVIEFD